jgi:hypothetical protein
MGQQIVFPANCVLGEGESLALFGQGYRCFWDDYVVVALGLPSGKVSLFSQVS